MLNFLLLSALPIVLQRSLDDSYLSFGFWFLAFAKDLQPSQLDVALELERPSSRVLVEKVQQIVTI